MAIVVLAVLGRIERLWEKRVADGESSAGGKE
jgi:hypothetical protein